MRVFRHPKRYISVMNFMLLFIINFVFFYSANDVILSHMVTFLNDKTDKHLRASFFDNFVNVVAFVDQQCSPILCPLLQQVNLQYCYSRFRYTIVDIR